MAGPTAVNDLVKIDNRTIDLRPEVKVHRSFFGTLFQTVAALSTPAWFFPGVGTAIGASTMGLGVMGAQLQSRAAHPRYNTTAAPGAPMVFPGLGGGAAAPGYTAASLSSDPALSIMTARGASLGEIPQAIGGGR